MSHGEDRVKRAKVQTLRAEFEMMSMKDPEIIDEFRMKLSALVTNIRALGETVEESYIVKKLLRAFGQLEEMYVEEAVGTLKAHEERLDGQIEKPVGQLMLNEEEWEKREASEGRLQFSREEWLKRSNKSRGTSSYQGQHDKSKEKEKKLKANLAQIQDDEPALLLTEFEKVNNDILLLNEKGLVPKLQKDEAMKVESNLWYLDNEASNHMTGLRSKFNELDERVTRQVKFGDGSLVEIKGKGSMLFKCKIGEERIFHKIRKSFPSHANFRVKQPLELIHRDLCGSITPATKAGNKYFVLLVDDYSRVMWVYLLSRKDEALGAFKKFKLLVERDSEKKVKMMRTDRGGEFCSKKFIEYCDNMGISRQFTTPYTPQ
ncbi:uncharacterized protein LOC141666139 [Apium graveolens]|uniref:uncharacterized protein LOC141666139 n=1 Tax=Apium graveolens TaxID=4045 RepID=UPI003D795667